MTIKFNDEHIPDSPFRVPVLPSSGDARNVTVEALKQKGLEVSLVRMDCAVSLHHESSVLSRHVQDAVITCIFNITLVLNVLPAQTRLCNVSCITIQITYMYLLSASTSIPDPLISFITVVVILAFPSKS